MLELLADLLPQLTGGGDAAVRAAELLRGGSPGAEAARLDAHHALLRQHFVGIEKALADLPAGALDRLGGYFQIDQPVPLDTGPDTPTDALALRLLRDLAPWRRAARRLAVALARLVEDAPRLKARHRLPLGRGFEDVLDRRLWYRFALLPGRRRLLTFLHRHRQLLLEEPGETIEQIERDLGRALRGEERAWLEVERRVATLRFVRGHKTEDGHIRWYVRRDARHGFVLDRLGVHGHWAVCGPVDAAILARVGTAVEREPGSGTRDGWCVVNLAEPGDCDAVGSSGGLGASYRLPSSLLGETDSLELRRQIRRLVEQGSGPATPLRSPEGAEYGSPGQRPGTNPAMPPFQGSGEGGEGSSLFPRALPWAILSRPFGAPEVPGFAMVADDAGCCLRARNGDEGGGALRVAWDANDDGLLDFLDRLLRVADLAVPVEHASHRHRGEPVLAWVRATLRAHESSRDRGARVRIVYVPSAIPHELGGVPEIGAAFLRDRLERTGARVDVVQMPRAEFESRLVELLGADVVGIGVYVHNRDDVAELVRRLRAAGFAGRIVLGGPETRTIEAVQESISGWDAIIRGEGEEVLPRVLDYLRALDRGEFQTALDLAGSLRGVVLRYGDAVLHCDTAYRNRAEAIVCPLPFDWGRGAVRRRVKMNFTRGCPYWCSFCPNHQGRRFASGAVDELWRFTVLAVADDLPLPAEVEEQVARTIQERLAVAALPRLRPALYLLGGSRATRDGLEAVVHALRPVIDPRVWADGDLLEKLVGLRQTVAEQLCRLGEGPLLPWLVKETWLVAKTAVLASRQLWHREGSHADLLPALTQGSPFVLETSEDNTLVNRKQVVAYLLRRKQYGLAGDFVFNPGQNTIQDLLQGPNRETANEDYIALLADDNPFAVALGADGPSNAILRQNQKPLYGVAGLLAVNKALGRHAREVANNYILLTPETDLLEAVESFVLFLLLPVPWRDYGDAINLRVIKEETTLATDEGLLFDPMDTGYDVPFRFPEVQRLLDRWELTSRVPTRRLRPLLWRILENDPEAQGLLPLLVQRWECNFDDDPEIAALAVLVREELPDAESLVHALWRLAERVQSEAFQDGRTTATFRDLVRSPAPRSMTGRGYSSASALRRGV
jgi:methylmalonyl-CoA mutase cobalamin-binding subunit